MAAEARQKIAMAAPRARLVPAALPTLLGAQNIDASLAEHRGTMAEPAKRDRPHGSDITHVLFVDSEFAGGETISRRSIFRSNSGSRRQKDHSETPQGRVTLPDETQRAILWVGFGKVDGD